MSLHKLEFDNLTCFMSVQGNAILPLKLGNLFHSRGLSGVATVLYSTYLPFGYPHRQSKQQYFYTPASTVGLGIFMSREMVDSGKY